MQRNLCLLFTFVISSFAYSAISQEITNTEVICDKTVEEDPGPLKIKLGTRLDYGREYVDGDAVRENNGFRGKYLFLEVNGNLGNKFSYSYRQRINEIHKNKDFFDGTDFLNVTYKINSKWDITAGKMALYIGSWEYDRNPQYVYNFSEWLNSLSCFKFGVSVGYNVTQKSRLTAQVAESPFNQRNDLYSYNLGWSGNYGWLQTMYSANVMEYRPGKFIYYLALGNRFNLGKCVLELDYINRATERHAFFFKDCSIVGELAYAPAKHWNLILKGAYSVNNTNDPSDLLLTPGTELTQLTGGAEFFPLKDGDRNLRFYAVGGYNWGTNTNPNAVVKDDQLLLNVGVQFYMDLVSLAKKAWNRVR